MDAAAKISFFCRHRQENGAILGQNDRNYADGTHQAAQRASASPDERPGEHKDVSEATTVAVGATNLCFRDEAGSQKY